MLQIFLPRNKKHKYLIFCSFLCALLTFSFVLGSMPVSGQIYPFYPVTQPFIPSSRIPFSINSSGLINPFVPPINSLSFFNPFTLLSRSSFLPSANIAGSLVPFTSTNFYNPLPLGFPYTAAALYYAAITPDIAGTWLGTWVSTFLAGGVLTGELSLTLAQNGTEVTGTLVFLLNKILKYGAYVVGTVEGSTLTLTSTVTTSLTGTMVFDVTLIATVTDVIMEGSYEIINLTTGLIAEQGTFTATKL